jgi:hypothetical protein
MSYLHCIFHPFTYFLGNKSGTSYYTLLCRLPRVGRGPMNKCPSDIITICSTYGDHHTPTYYNGYPTYVKQMLRYQTKEDLQRIEDLCGRPTDEDNTVPPATPTTTDTAPAAVPSTAEIPMVVTTINTT